MEKITERVNQGIALHHINLRVKDYMAAKNFYVNGLSCRCTGEREHKDGFMMSMLEFPGGGIMELVGGGTAALPEDFEQRVGSYVHVAFKVEDVEAAMEKLIKCGGKKRGDIRDKELPFPMHMGVVRGTAGELVELIKLL